MILASRPEAIDHRLQPSSAFEGLVVPVRQDDAGLLPGRRAAIWANYPERAAYTGDTGCHSPKTAAQAVASIDNLLRAGHKAADERQMLAATSGLYPEHNQMNTSG